MTMAGAKTITTRKVRQPNHFIGTGMANYSENPISESQGHFVMANI
jgi:hypothetical protein